MALTENACPLCLSKDQNEFAHRPERGDFLICRDCGLVHIKPEFRLNSDEEKARYLEHDNDPNDSGYRGFLNRLAVPLIEQLEPNDQGLDYGSGPGPALAMILEEAGFKMNIYDPFFSPDKSVLDRSYDFVTCTEVAEHFYYPQKEFQFLFGLIKPGGWLAVMTEFMEAPPSADRFRSWFYARDPSHVCFYQMKTMEWIAKSFNAKLKVPRKNVALFQI